MREVECNYLFVLLLFSYNTHAMFKAATCDVQCPSYLVFVGVHSSRRVVRERLVPKLSIHVVARVVRARIRVIVHLPHHWVLLEVHTAHLLVISRLVVHWPIVHLLIPRRLVVHLHHVPHIRMLQWHSIHLGHPSVKIILFLITFVIVILILVVQRICYRI